ncbi:Kinesin [Thalictrum thalictroides]|uniref:Kinesin n=1 Tax=Thalictrum thalictroides TaxID=46969 RepID=A0A7J6WNE9_THATH|nr:Kinesin [Thalictrum thalictroides]
MIQGLSNRKVGATTINSKSSRSHIVFTCVIESWCKGTSSKGFSSSKTSRISLIDVAGSERNKLDDAGRECVKEGKNVKKSLSQLGHLVHILAKGAQSESSENIPYTNSCLTHLLKESLGGNAKLTIICAISPDEKCKGETLSTLRFGVKAKSIQNEPVENEIKEDDVNDLSDRIRQLKEELIKEKSTGVNSVAYNSSYFKGKSARDSLNQLRVSLNRSMILPRLDNDSKDIMTIDEKDVKELCVQLDNLRSSGEEFQDACEETDFQSCEETDGEHEDDHFSEKFETELCSKDSGNEGVAFCGTSSTIHHGSRSSLSISPCEMPSFLQEPTLSESPKIENIQMRSLPTSSNLSACHVPQSSNTNSEVKFQSVKRSDHIRESLRSSKMFSSPTDSLAASLHRGLQLIDYHQRASASKSSVALSFEHLALRSSLAIKQGDAILPTLIEGKTHLDGPGTPFICATCKRESNELGEVQDSLNMCIVPFDEPRSSGLKDKTVKDGEKVVDEARKREELEKVCAEQAAKIEQLNVLVEQYKHEKEQNSLLQKTQEMSINKDEAFTSGVGGMQDLEKEKHILLLEEKEDESKNPGDASDADISAAKSELKGLQEEREGLLKEIDTLKNKLQCYVDVSWIESQSTKLRESYNANSSNKTGKELEEERQMWIEKESEWICLTDELRVDLDSNRRHAENVEMELRLEKRVTEELDDALNRAVLGHARFVEHYADLQDKYNELLERHQKIMEGIAEVKRAAAKAGAKGKGSRFAKSLAAELSVLRVEREREREHLKKENKSLRIQLRDTAEAVHAAGELLVRLREAEEAVSVAEENYIKAQKDSEKVKKQMEKQKRKHAMEMVTMKQYLAESRLPESALQPMYWQEEEKAADHTTTSPLLDDDQAWRAEFGPIYQEHY